MKIYLQKSWARQAWEFFIYSDDGKTYYKVDFIVKQSPRVEGQLREPSLIVLDKLMVRDNVISALTKALCDAGLMQNSSACEAELSATKLHLKDMQKAFGKVLEK